MNPDFVSSMFGLTKIWLLDWWFWLKRLRTMSILRKHLHVYIEYADVIGFAFLPLVGLAPWPWVGVEI